MIRTYTELNRCPTTDLWQGNCRENAITGPYSLEQMALQIFPERYGSIGRVHMRQPSMWIIFSAYFYLPDLDHCSHAQHMPMPKRRSTQYVGERASAVDFPPYISESIKNPKENSVKCGDVSGSVLPLVVSISSLQAGCSVEGIPECVAYYSFWNVSNQIKLSQLLSSGTDWLITWAEAHIKHPISVVV